MVDININPGAVEVANTQLPSIISRVNGVNKTVTGLRTAINNNIQNRSNIRARLTKVQNDINQMESDLRAMHKAVNNIVEIYDKNEAQQLNNINKLGSL